MKLIAFARTGMIAVLLTACGPGSAADHHGSSAAGGSVSTNCRVKVMTPKEEIALTERGICVGCVMDDRAEEYRHCIDTPAYRAHELAIAQQEDARARAEGLIPSNVERVRADQSLRDIYHQQWLRQKRESQ